MSGSHAELGALQGDSLVLSFGHAQVSDAMRRGVITCPPEESMATVARIMAREHSTPWW